MSSMSKASFQKEDCQNMSGLFLCVYEDETNPGYVILKKKDYIVKSSKAS